MHPMTPEELRAQREFERLGYEFYSAFRRGNHEELKKYWNLMQAARNDLKSKIENAVRSRESKTIRSMFQSINNKVIKHLNRSDAIVAMMLDGGQREHRQFYYYMVSKPKLKADHMIRALDEAMPLEQTMFWQECIQNPDIWNRYNPDRWSFQEYENSKLYSEIQQEIAQKRAQTIMR